MRPFHSMGLDPHLPKAIVAPAPSGRKPSPMARQNNGPMTHNSVDTAPAMGQITTVTGASRPNQPQGHPAPTNPSPTGPQQRTPPMAKKNTQAEASPIDTPAESTTPTITIQGLIFPITMPFSEGHPLTATEASALNNLRGENLRNNFAAKIKALLVPKDGPERTAADLTEDEKATLAGEFQAYDSSYTLSGKRSAKAPIDPVEREATRIAKEQVDAALRRRGIEKKALAEGQYDNYVAQLLEKNPAIRDEARAYIARLRDVGANAVADDLLGVPQAAE